MAEVVAYFITWTTYGSWLPGDKRGWAKKKEWGIQAPDPEREETALRLMTENDVVLSDEMRAIVDAVIVEHCRIRGWVLHARNVRTNHVHVVITANVDPETIREQLKAWASRRLSEHVVLIGRSKQGQKRWWTEKGDIECVRDQDHLESVIHYVTDCQ